MSTILNNPFTKPYDTAPFSQIHNEDFLPAIQKEIENTLEEIHQITVNDAAPTFENTIEALDFTGMQLDRITSIFFNLNSAETNTQIQEIAQKVSPLLSEFQNDIRLNEALFLRIKAVYDQKETLKLTPEQNTLLEKKYKMFFRNGATLATDQKAKLREIDKTLSQLSLTFGENVLADTNAYELLITKEEDLAGIPEGAREAAFQKAKKNGKEGWIFTLEYPSYIPFMTYAENRELRKKLFLAFSSKCFHENATDNKENILKIARLRHERAQLLGFDSHAHYVLEERMAETPEKVMAFLHELLEKAKPAATKEFKMLTDFARQADGIEQLQKWDNAFYAEKLKQKLFQLDDEKLKPYFKLENVIQGVFTIAKKLYGLTFEEVFDIDRYHEEVQTFKVLDTNSELVAIFYADYHPRPGKRGGAWMTSFKSQYQKEDVNQRPHVSIVCNFTPSTPTKPSLLTFNEVTTLFHEFGHALHGMLANTTYPSLSGTSVFWDFVELPSQVLENWCYEKEALELFATHYETGEKLPMEYITKIKESANFMEGMQTLRQLSFGLLDMKWHTGYPDEGTEVKALENEVFTLTDLYPEVPGTCMSTAFSHIFQGGYSSGYYSYKWAEVLDADAFDFFKEKGIFNKDVANAFKNHVLSQGGTQPPIELYVRFRGKKPTPDALLRRAGLVGAE